MSKFQTKKIFPIVLFGTFFFALISAICINKGDNIGGKALGSSCFGDGQCNNTICSQFGNNENTCQQNDTRTKGAVCFCD
ncbi:hypothetical protein F8M41_017476 [Gigaspora margarita]|uniref:Uncharacterized protein n=1 Tax=Gigaspora margarita TaxID=4874 RepID=A0A8H4EM62_GIGMA|nr:hypothetical protein F8M41_017476 [Gigaspora margarita]